MSENPENARPAETYAEVEDALLSRWPETKLEPSLDRIKAFTELLGEPQKSLRVIHLTGTNGKTSTSRMIERLQQTDMGAGAHGAAGQALGDQQDGGGAPAA